MLPAEPLKLDEAAAADEETAGEAMHDHAASPVAAMIVLGRECGCVTRGELDGALSPGEAGAANIEDAMTVLFGPGIVATEGREPEEDAGEARPEGPPAAASAGTAGDDPGRVDDLLAMYLRDMGGTALLTREGEVALAKRIEAGRQAVLDGLCWSLPAMRTVSAWRDRQARPSDPVPSSVTVVPRGARSKSGPASTLVARPGRYPYLPGLFRRSTRSSAVFCSRRPSGSVVSPIRWKFSRFSAVLRSRSPGGTVLPTVRSDTPARSPPR